MNNNDNILGINEFDFNLICEYFSYNKRQGPGSTEASLKALSMIGSLPCAAKIADIGCGTGASTVVLAKALGLEVTAIDLFPQFIDILRARAVEEGVSKLVHAIVGSMESLPFAENSLDLIWSEGAIYNIGFERGLSEWGRLLKAGGYIAVTEPTWLTDDRPEEIAKFWDEAYSEVETAPNKIQKMMRAGFTPIASFALPDECWIENYYLPQKTSQDLFLSRHPDNEFAKELVRNQRHEAELYAKYKKYYGYYFYIGKKN